MAGSIVKERERPAGRLGGAEFSATYIIVRLSIGQAVENGGRVRDRCTIAGLFAESAAMVHDLW